MLSVFALLAFLILVGLGAWQVQRLGWKRDLLAEVAAARTAMPVDLVEALDRAKRDESVDLLRVRGTCLNDRPATPAFLYGLSAGEIGWRVVSACRLPGSPGYGVLVDRGLLEERGPALLSPVAYPLPPPAEIVGVLRLAEDKPTPFIPPVGADIEGRQVFERSEYGLETLRRLLDLERAPLLLLSIERESPPLANVRPAPLPTRISNNHLGYAVTWFGLAAALVGVYAAMLRRPRVAA